MKKFYFWNIMTLVVLSMLPYYAKTQISVWNGTCTPWSNGSGTEEDPFLIENAQQLAYLAQMVNQGTTYDNICFKLLTDIQIDSITPWLPIGTNYTYYFGGDFDGNDHTITIFMNSDSPFVGIFGYVKGSDLTNLNVSGKIVSTCNLPSPTIERNRICIGGVVGYADGICGDSVPVPVNDNPCIINHCNNSCEIIYLGNYYDATVGGIVGLGCCPSNLLNNNPHTVISNCHNSGNIYSGNVFGTGGIVGHAWTAVTVHDCYNVGNITANGNGDSGVGGIIGVNDAEYTHDCYNTGNIMSNGAACAGGIIGRLCWTLPTYNCYNSGNISSNGRAGGVVGSFPSYLWSDWNPMYSVFNSYNVGQVYSPYSSNGIAGIAGYYSHNQELILNCFYLNTCGGGGDGTPMTSTQMQSVNFPALLNTDSVVFVMDFPPFINMGYPIFGKIRTLVPTDVSYSSATLNGVYSMPYEVDSIGFEYKLATDTGYTEVYSFNDNPTSYTITELQSGTTYEYCFFVEKNGVKLRGIVKTFTTMECSVFATIIASQNNLCEGDSVSCNVVVTSEHPSQYQYLWSNGSTTNSINVAESGVYTVTVTSAEGCSASTNFTVTVNPLPNVNITGNSSFCQSTTTTLSATGASTYAWSNGSTVDAITINAAGTYTVTGTDANGCSNTATHSVSVTPTYNTPLSHSLCEGESYNFYGQNITTAGTYTHTLQTVNGCDSVLTLVVTLEALPTITISGNTMLCEGESSTLTANGGISYNWSNGSASSNVTISQGGVYTVTATNTEGCSNTANITVTVNPLPSVNITGNSSFCQGDNTTLTAMGASTYVWNNSQTNNAITVNNSGTYTVTGTDANGCTNTATKTVSMNPTYNIPLTHSICEGESYNFYGQNITAAGTYTHTLQTINGCDSVLTLVVTLEALPTIAISGNTTLCEGESTTLTANGGVSYNWSNGSATNSINVAESGVYTVTATNVEGCSATASATVTVNPLPIVVIGGNTSICEGGSTTLAASGADTYSWSTGDNTASATISAFGIYNVTGTSAAGCSSEASVTVLVSQLPVITITGETDICVGESTTLTANGGTTYLWSNGTTDATLTVSNAGTYQVIGYNEAGCNAIASATVNVWQPATSEFSVECPDSCYTWNDVDYCQTGDYTQTLQTVHGCDSVVTLHLTITVGVDDYNGFDFKVYPNPTNGVVDVQCIMHNVQFGDVELQLVDAYGRLLDVVGANNYSPLQTVQIDLSRYATGIYFVKAVADGKTVAVRKVVRN